MKPDDFRERLFRRAACAGLTISLDQFDQLALYYRLLVHWSRTINLTALPLVPLSDQAIDRLLIEPLSAARQWSGSSGEWFDLGSGGGSPAIPFRIAQPGLRLTMVESRTRKAAFLREVARELNFADVLVRSDRFELLTDSPNVSKTATLVTVRAVRLDASLVAACRALLAPGGRLFLFATGTDARPDNLFGTAQRIELIPDGSSVLFVCQPQL